MPVDDQIASAQQSMHAAAQHPEKQVRTRQSDEGPVILPGMQHFVTLLRKAKRPGLVLLLVEHTVKTALPELAALTDAAKCILPVLSRKAMFHAVAKLGAEVQQRIERAAERVVLLDDEYGAQAVQSLLNEQDVDDAAILAMPSDRYSRALYLWLRQEFPEAGATREQRFDHAERQQVIHRQWKSENYSSHYLGPKGVMPCVDAGVEEVLRTRIAALFPQIAAGEADQGQKITTDNRVLFHRVANTLNYLDINTVIVSCGTCMDQLMKYQFEKIFPGCRLLDIHEYLMEKGLKLDGITGTRYMYHEPCHTPMKVHSGIKVANELMGTRVDLSDRCCGESGTLAVARPDISTQVRFRKQEEIEKGAEKLRGADAATPVKILTSCPSCLQGLSRYSGDANIDADYIVVEMAKHILGDNWMAEYVAKANNGGIERVLL